jgi:hypothetical protein
MTDRFVFSDGATFTSMVDALVHLKLNPGLTVTEHGVDITARFKRILTNHGYGTSS